MYDSNSKGISYTAGFFLLIVFAIGGLFLGGFISIPIWTTMTGTTWTAMKDELGNPAYSNAFKVIQGVSTLCGFFVPGIVAASLLNRKPFKLLGFTGRINWVQVVLVLAIMFLALFASTSFGYLNQHIPLSQLWETKFKNLENDYNSQVEAIMQLRNPTDYLMGLLIMAFLPALCEETLFRGGLQNFLSRSTRNPWFAIIIVSMLFSAVHFSFYGFLPRMFLGIMLGLIYYYTGSLWLSILAHFANNAVTVSQFYFGSESIKQAAEQNTPISYVYVGILALPFIIVLFIILKKVSPRQPSREFSMEDIRSKAPWEINN